MKKTWVVTLVLGALVVVGGLGASRLTSQPQVIEADLAKVEPKALRPAILASGALAYRQEVQLSSEVIGKVAEVLVKEGDRIEQGQVLLRLDPSAYKAEVLAQEARMRSTEVAIERSQLNVKNRLQNLERNRRLVAEKFIDASRYDESAHQSELSQVELRASREELRQAQAQLAQSRERLAKTEVRAPLAGTVTAVQIKVGETAVASATGIAGSSLMTIADVSSMNAEVSVDEADIARVVTGQSVRVFPAALADQPVAGTVERVSMAPRAAAPGAAAQGRSYNVRVRLDSVPAALRTGMTCRVEIVTAATSARPSVPLQAVQAAEEHDTSMKKNANYVFAVVDGKVTRKEVDLGLADDAHQEVLKGLAKGDTVVIGPARLLRTLKEGDKVKQRQEGDTKLAKPAPGAAT